MAKLLSLLLCVLPVFGIAQQTEYFPPTDSDEWESVSPESLGWCVDEIDTLIGFLEAKNTKAFMILYKGRIVMEEYFGTFTQDSLWLWNSAGKTITAFTVGKAQEEGFLDINEASSNYLGEGWTSCTPEQEAAITIRHQLTMTTGLSDLVDDVYCTDPECLEYLEPAGERWAYHNGPYTMLDQVVAEATGMNYNLYVFSKLQSIGMSGFFVPVGYNKVYISTARDMARFGIMIDNGGQWNGSTVMEDNEYFNAMITPSQDLNESYGYLWWLNGQDTYMVPGLQFTFPGPFITDAPSDLVAAIGKDAQILHVVNSEDLVVVRMGLNPDEEVVPVIFNLDLWELLDNILCDGMAIAETEEVQLSVYPNPATEVVTIQGITSSDTWKVFDNNQRLVLQGSGQEVHVSQLPEGHYLVVVKNQVLKLIINH